MESELVTKLLKEIKSDLEEAAIPLFESTETMMSKILTLYRICQQSIDVMVQQEMRIKRLLVANKELHKNPKPFNLNDTVTVKLTAVGVAIINSYFSLPNEKHDYEIGDTYSCQLWDLMHMFGKMFYNGGPIPFIDNEIYFVDNEMTITRET